MRLTLRVFTFFLLLFNVTAPASGLCGPALERGVGMHGPLTWGRTNEARTEYLWPVYEGKRYDIPIKMLPRVKAAGFDFIRLTVDPGPLLAHKGEKLDALYEGLVQTVREIRAAELDVLVDVHPISMMKAYSAAELEGDKTDAYIEMLGRLTQELSKLELSHVAIEPMNEPQVGWGLFGNSKLQSLMERMYKAVRVKSADITIVLSGGRGGSILGLTNLDPTPFLQDANVRYSFHYYLPYIFTMQGVTHSGDGKDSKLWQMVTDLPYPVAPQGYTAYWKGIEKKIEQSTMSPDEKAATRKEAKEQLGEYFGEKGNRYFIDKEFDKALEWAKKYGIAPERILMGEFGATQPGPSWQGADVTSRATWIADVRKAAEARGFRWAFWNFYGAGPSKGMTLVDVRDAQKLDMHTLKALGVGFVK